MQYNITYREKDKGIQYIISYKDKLDKWKQKSKQGFQTKKEAKAAAQLEVKTLEKDLKLKDILSKEHEGITFKEFTDMFITHERLYKEPNTVLGYKYAIRVFNDLNELEMVKIRNINLQNRIDQLTKKGLKGSTIKSYVKILKVIFNSALDQYKIISFSPVQNIIIPKDKNETEKTALTKLELDTLLNKITNRKYYMISSIAGKCGLRIGEILGLTWDNIDENRLMIKVTQQWKQLDSGVYDFGILKTKNSKREVPISPNLLAEILKYKKDYPRNYNGRIFGNKNADAIRSSLADKYHELGYPISVHELRHTYATLLIGNGMNPKMASVLLGHDVQETMRTYSHVTTDMQEMAIKLINNIFD
ncbi:site-specific integrase [Clostridium sp. CF012]|uniref:site-specific integrase n=1 Tax=Clostridium sp. CF012 TaxID=2843319 RepID=UPI001C0D2BB7|nr:site-specific integrase [Clostridium sp. CF012]MBU3146599.1 site-specific integrase [Clostridium sp. CF012]